MAQSIASWIQVAGVAVLTLLATSVPPSARPTAPLVKSQAGQQGPESSVPVDVPNPDEAPALPMAVVSVDLGDVWFRASTVEVEDVRTRPADQPLVASIQLDGARPWHRADHYDLNAPQATVASSRWTFLTTSRPHAPPLA